MIAIISKASLEAQEHAAKALWHLASTLESQNAILEAKGIEPLVGMLSADGQKAPELAAITIVRLTENNMEVSKSIAACHGIVPLVRLLSIGSSAAQPPACRHRPAQAGGPASQRSLLTGKHGKVT